MTKLWFKTKNDKIVDLLSFKRFEIEEYREGFIIYAYEFCEDGERQEMADFNKKTEAQLYLDEIYLLLTTKTTLPLPDCLSQCDPTTSKGNSLCK